MNTASCAKVDAAFGAAAALLATLLLLAPAARAHVGHTSYCTARTVLDGLEVKLDVPLALARQASDPLRDLEGHVRAVTPGGECALAARGPSAGPQPNTAHFDLYFSCPAGPVTLSIDYGMDVDRTAETVCALDGNAHVFREGALDYLIGTPPTLLAQLSSFVRFGALHVVRGLDHVLFVVSLLLGAAGAGIRASGPALRRLVTIVTGFTLGHSLTLILAALGIFKLPAALTESLIALSIVFVALHNVVAEAPRGRALISTGFGLIHGFGFASALAELGLPRRATLASLLAFNVGIELAQLLLVFACFPGLLWASRRPWFRSGLLVPSCCLIAGVAALWFVKRAFGSSVLPWLGS